jgi:tetratricopeptide (TPR) repeat protein
MLDLRPRKTLFIFFFISAFAIYGTSLYFPKFIFDDDLNIFQNWQVENFSIANFIFFLKTSLTPIPYILWQFISNTTGHMSTWNYRLFNILVHSLNASLLFILTTRVHSYLKLKGSSFSFAFLSSIIFLFHPVQVESVVWLSSLRILSATFFTLVSCLMITDFALFSNKEDQAKKHHAPLAIIFFGFALLCKPTVLPLIATMSFLPLVKSAISEDQLQKRDIVNQLKLILPPIGAVIFIGLLSVILHKGEVLTAALKGQTLLEKANLVTMSISASFLNLFLPLRLVFDYQINPFTVNYLVEANKFTLPSLFAYLIIISTLSLTLIKRLRLFGVCFLMIFVLISPHIGLVFQDFQNISTVADRYLYLSVIPLAWLISGILSSVVNKKREFLLGGTISFILIILCLKQIALWQKPELILEKSNIHDEIQAPLLVALGQNYESRGFLNKSKIFYKDALTKDQQIKGALPGLIALANQVPSVKDALFIINCIKKNKVMINPEDTTLYAKLLIQTKRYKEAKLYLEENLSRGISPIKTQNLLFEIKNRSADTLIQSYQVLYHYHQGLNQPKRALEYLKKLIKLPGAPKHLIRRYEEHSEQNSGKK